MVFSEASNLTLKSQIRYNKKMEKQLEFSNRFHNKTNSKILCLKRIKAKFLLQKVITLHKFLWSQKSPKVYRRHYSLYDNIACLSSNLFAIRRSIGLLSSKEYALQSFMTQCSYCEPIVQQQRTRMILLITANRKNTSILSLN